jgi:hypothetical protein
LRKGCFHLTASLFRHIVLMIVENQEVRYSYQVSWESIRWFWVAERPTGTLSVVNSTSNCFSKVFSGIKPCQMELVSDVFGDFLRHHHQGLVWWVVRLRFRIRPRLRPLDRPVLSVPSACYAVIICSTVTTRVNRPSISAASVGRWLAFLVWPLGPGAATFAAVATSYIFLVVMNLEATPGPVRCWWYEYQCWAGNIYRVIQSNREIKQHNRPFRTVVPDMENKN